MNRIKFDKDRSSCPFWEKELLDSYTNKEIEKHIEQKDYRCITGQLQHNL